MIELINILEEEVKKAFKQADYPEDAARLTVSNRPDLCEFQCNGAMALAKELHKNPIEIAENVVSNLKNVACFEKVEAIKPGFININVSSEFLSDYLNKVSNESNLGLDSIREGKSFFLDYGGPNVAKPLHVGHLRSAIIGESIKRLLKSTGAKVISDIHLGDWGQQMGLIINELRNRKPDLPYFDDSFHGEYPKESPFTLSELEEIYPYASAKSKEDDEYKKKAMECTHRLQQKDRAYNAILSHILDLSITDLKKNYERLNVDFDLWKGESDAAPYINDMVEKMKNDGYVYESEGALVVDVSEESDTKEIPPCMILKSDGAALYNTTDLATLCWRIKDYNPSEIIYIVDKRQGLYFTQVFRCSKKTGIVPEDTNLTFLGFGTMNGPDNKPFKTRDGGVLRLSYLLDDVKEKCLEKIKENESIPEAEKEKTAEQIALAAIKYGDLSNAPVKDYIFDVSRFISFEGNTGPYILYTIVRIKSILRKYVEEGGNLDLGKILPFNEKSAKDLCLVLSRFNSAVYSATRELAPNRICAYIYELSNAFNSFYHGTKILSCPDEDKKFGYIKLLQLTQKVLEAAIDLLGFSAPERM